MYYDETVLFQNISMQDIAVPMKDFITVDNLDLDSNILSVK